MDIDNYSKPAVTALLRAALFMILVTIAPAVWCIDGGTLFPVTRPDTPTPATDSVGFLPAAQAFGVEASIDGRTLQYRFHSAPGYVLYRQRFEFTPTDAATRLGEPVYDRKGKPKHDPTFGEVEAFADDVVVSIPVLSSPDGFVEVKAQFQGCAEKGLCYLPQYHTEMFQLAPADTQGPRLQPARPEQMQNPAPPPRDSADGLARFLDNAGWLRIAAVFFGLGLALSLTPCMLPMVPILTSLIVGEARRGSARDGFLLSSSYVLGMSLTYTLAGVAAGATGAHLQYWLQNPAVITATAALFVVLSLSMFGFYELQLPAFLRDHLHRAQSRHNGGHFVGAFLMGALSSLVVSPCVSAPLMGALLYIGNSGDAALGGFALFMLSLGMGAPLIVLGTTEANILPRAGGWMDNVKGLFGVMLLGVALWISRALLPDPALPVAAGALVILAGLYLGAFDTLTHARGKLFKALGLSATTLGMGLILAGCLQWSGITLPASRQEAASLPFQRVTTQAGLDAVLADARTRHQAVMVDLWAEWCIACKEMDSNVLEHPDVRAALTSFRLIKLDLTDTPDGSALLERFHLPGPPAYLFFTPEGGELVRFRVVGSMPADAFLQHLRALPIDTP